MKVDKELIKHVADVARLDLTSNEIKKFEPELKEIIESFKSLDDANVDGVKPSFQPVELANHLREDKIKPSLSQEDALKLSKHTKDGYFKGPKAV